MSDLTDLSYTLCFSMTEQWCVIGPVPAMVGGMLDKVDDLCCAAVYA